MSLFDQNFRIAVGNGDYLPAVKLPGLNMADAILMTLVQHALTAQTVLVAVERKESWVDS